MHSSISVQEVSYQRLKTMHNNLSTSTYSSFSHMSQHFVNLEFSIISFVIDSASKLPLKISTTKVVEVPASAVAKPYKYHSIDTSNKDYYEAELKIQYYSIETLFRSISKLYELFKAKNSFHYEQDLDKMFFFNQEFFSNMSFDKTRIKSLSEKTLIQKEFRVKQIIPMVQVEGLLYLTNKRVYFQPFHSIYKKPVINFKIKDINELFKRRYKLMNIGLEFLTKKHKKNLYVAFSNTEDRDNFY